MSRPFVRACGAWIVVALVFVTASAGQRLVLIGGGDRPPAAMARFDGDTALFVVDDRYGEVVGTSYVTIVDAQARSGALVLTMLEPGRRFDLRKRQVVGSKRATATD